jgi:phage tail tape-measure protein
LLGFVVGQSLIPIPFVGAILGGFVGGYIGDKGGKAIINKL